jgi:hypothetical protein
MVFAFLAMAGWAMLHPEIIEAEKDLLNTVLADLSLRKPGPSPS